MNGKGKATEHERRDWTIILIILLFGFLFVSIAASLAVRLSPTWKLNTNMRSNLDPNSDFLTNRPVNVYGPLDSAILTQPPWLGVFLTPGASFATRTPVPITNTPRSTNTLAPTITITPTKPTNTPTVIYYTPTKTAIYYPPPPTNTPMPPATNTPVTPTPTAIPVDLQITKTDGSTTYTAGASITYTLVITNAGTNNVTGATLRDPKPAQVTTWGWCVAPCTPTANSSANLSATINLASGASVTYTLLANTDPSATVDLTNTATVSAPAGYTDTNTANNSATDTDTFTASSDLQITKTDNSTEYVAGAIKTYVIVVSNAGPSDVTNATITDTFTTNPNIASATWTCSSATGGTCSASGSGNINDTVNLPSGASVTYMVSATVVGAPSGNLVNTASVTTPSDPNTGNNSATDTDTLITTDTPPTEFGGPPDNNTYTLPAGGSLTLSINLIADGNTSDWDLVYYEYSLALLPPPDTFDGIWLDWVIIEISDGSNWYTVFNWGNNVSDTNTNVALNLLSLPLPPPNTDEEMDQRPIASSNLYNNSGVAIDVDSIVPPGTYTYIRITAPPGDVDGQAEIDTIEILP
jgi:uncharacterized repeat protein (TIGR01451 family)